MASVFLNLQRFWVKLDDMLKFSSNKWVRRFLGIALCLVAAYGSVRLYYFVTDGFSLGNISSDFAYDARWELPPLTESDRAELQAVLSQPFTYLTKGCQTYVFISQDRHYVLKFFKYQRFRLKPWVDYLTFLPYISHYREKRLVEKRQNLDRVFHSFVLGYRALAKESGLFYVHLNKTSELNTVVEVTDKMGIKHQIDLDGMEFVLQRTATMLCAKIRDLMVLGEAEQAKQIIAKIISLELAEYQLGLGDEDYALMQNMGVVEDRPIHIDIGQVAYDSQLKDPQVAKKHLFNRMFKFHRWLKEDYPQLAQFLDQEMYQSIGEAYFTMTPDPQVRVSLKG